jgi:hypothetical protein
MTAESPRANDLPIEHFPRTMPCQNPNCLTEYRDDVLQERERETACFVRDKHTANGEISRQFVNSWLASDPQVDVAQPEVCYFRP